ncbi:MAG TPA: hypothetical protein VL282_14345 [Tepidisphaeraceae bacterium]|nr:hypothetical protein [Tepidisphaeraceae bacterium]
MKRLTPTFILINLLALQSFAQPILADYDQELRTPDGHFDTPRTLTALKSMGCNTYFYLIHHSKYDWDDLPAFADAAAKEKIDVWVHINPWSETTLYKKNWNYSEPFKTDYVKWATEIAKLSLAHKNIVGFVIDDFYTNATLPDREGFTPKYTEQIHNAYKSISPKLKFYPLIYFEQPWSDFVEKYGKFCDGVVGAYPRTEAEIVNANTYLRDEYHGPSMIAKLGRGVATDEDEGVLMTGDFYIEDPGDASLSFYWDVFIREQTAERGFHYAVAYVNGRMIWSADCSKEPEQQFIRLDLSKYVPRNRKIHIELGMLEKTAVHTFAIQVNFDNVRIRGAKPLKGGSNPDLAWKAQRSRNFTAKFFKPSTGKNRFNLPMIVMPSANGQEHELRFNEPGTPENIAEKLHMALEATKKNLTLGTVMFCTPKDEGNPYFKAVQGEYTAFANKNPPRLKY